MFRSAMKNESYWLVAGIVAVLGLPVAALTVPGLSSSARSDLLNYLRYLVVGGGVVLAGKLVEKSIRDREINLEWARTALRVLQSSDEEEESLIAWAVEVLEKLGPVPVSDSLEADFLKGDARMPGSDDEDKVAQFVVYEVCTAVQQAIRDEFLRTGAWDRLPRYDHELDVNAKGVDFLLMPAGPDGDFIPHPEAEDEHRMLTVDVHEDIEWARITDDEYITELSQSLFSKLESALLEHGIELQK